MIFNVDGSCHRLAPAQFVLPVLFARTPRVCVAEPQLKDRTGRHQAWWRSLLLDQQRCQAHADHDREADDPADVARPGGTASGRDTGTAES